MEDRSKKEVGLAEIAGIVGDDDVPIGHEKRNITTTEALLNQDRCLATGQTIH